MEFVPVVFVPSYIITYVIIYDSNSYLLVYRNSTNTRASGVDYSQHTSLLGALDRRPNSGRRSLDPSSPLIVTNGNQRALVSSSGIGLGGSGRRLISAHLHQVSRELPICV